VQSLTQENTLKSFKGEMAQNRSAIVSTGGSLHFLAGDTVLRNAIYDGQEKHKGGKGFVPVI